MPAHVGDDGPPDWRDPYYVAAQHGHRLQTMIKDYAARIPKGLAGT
jgi:hypothetical protein